MISVERDHTRASLLCSDQALESIALRVCGVSLIGDNQELSGFNTVPCALG